MKDFKIKGMTLVELIVALAIMCIIAVSLLAIFSSSYSNIFNFGRKSKAVTESQSIIDKIYERSVQGNFTTVLEVQDMVSSVLSLNGYTSDQYKLSSSAGSLSVIEGTEHIRYFVSDQTTQSGIDGFQVSVLVFYSNNKSSVTLTTFVIKGGS